MTDNPIFKTITDVLGLGHKPRSFSEKIDAIERLVGDKLKPGYNYTALLRADKGFSLTEGAISASGEQVGFLFDKLRKSGLVPQQAEGLFNKVRDIGGSIVFNESNRSLFYSTGDALTPMPVDVGTGLVSFNNNIRKVNSLRMGRQSLTFSEAYYSNLETKIVSGSGSTGVHTGLRDALRGIALGGRPLSVQGDPNKLIKLGSLMMGGTSTRGMLTPREGFWTGARMLDSGAYLDNDLKLAIEGFRNANSAFSMILKTAGRSIFTGLSPDRGTHSDALALIDANKQRYFDTLNTYLTRTGAINTVPFIKPEYLGTKKKFLVGSSMLSEVYGTKFEEHSIVKGLFQLAKIRSTTSSQIENALAMGQNPYAYYVTKNMGSKEATRELGFRVGVIDTTSDLYSKLYFQEGGGILTESGAKKLAFKAPSGTVKISSPTQLQIEAVEQVFGINLASGNKLTGLNASMVGREDYMMASSFRRYTDEELSPLQRNIRTLIKSSGKYRGILRQSAIENSILSKAELTESSLTLDFASSRAVTPGSIETVFGGRRQTNQRIERSALKGTIPESVLGQVDMFMGADEFEKIFGADVYLTNFIEKVRYRNDASEIFKQVFKDDALIPINHKAATGMVVAQITDHDSALKSAMAEVDKWKNNTALGMARLAEEIEKGTNVLTQSLAHAGIKGIRTFGMAGGIRTDYMGDINMMNPTRFTPSKMVTLAKGSKLLGYQSAAQDPVIRILTRNSIPWAFGEISVDMMSGELALSNQHILRKFSRALLGDPGKVYDADVITLRGGKFFKGDTQLKSLPALAEFSHKAGGVPFSELKNTILGQKSDMLYIDLGEHKKMNLLGLNGAEREYRYLPVPMKYLRANKGAHGRLVLDRTHPANQFLGSLIDMESGRPFDENQPLLYKNVIKSLAGKEGLLNKTSTILFNMGTRARLVAQSGNYYTPQSLMDPEQIFNSYISQSEFEDYIARKSPISKTTRDQSKEIRKAVKDRGFFYSLVNADPAQRGEHFQVQKIFVDKRAAAGNKLGQLNLSMHPLLFRMFERDVDRDPITLTPLEGISGMKRADFTAAMEERIARQRKAITPFLWYLNYEMKTKTAKLAENRFSGLVDEFKQVGNYLRDYIGAPKSMGYSITRASEGVMNEIIAYGVEGARNMGILGKEISEDMISGMIKPYVDDTAKLPVVQALLQNLFQGGVQKGQSKAALENVGKELVNIAQRYKGTSYNEAAARQAATELMEGFLLDDSNKMRILAGMDPMAEHGWYPGLDKPSVEAMRADLERGEAWMLSEGAEKIKEHRALLARAQADLLGEYLGRAMPLAASLPKSPKTVGGIIQKFLGNVETQDELTDMMDSVVGAAAGEVVPYKNKVLQRTTAAFDAAKQAADAAKQAADAPASWASRIGAKLKGANGQFGLGLGIGAVAGATIVGLMKGPEPPMARDVDDRQPMDTGPDIFQSTPKLYGTNQVFHSSRKRSPQTFSPVGSYNFNLKDSSTVTVRDKMSPYSPYLLDKEIRNTSRSDYSY